jgi:FtsZ-binding cell division protein ZapB
MILEHLKALEEKVKEAVTLLHQCQAEKEALEQRIKSFQDELRREQGEKITFKKTVERLEAEREEIRTRVDELLGEISRIEGALQERT